jgi:hypothetical protein
MIEIHATRDDLFVALSPKMISADPDWLVLEYIVAPPLAGTSRP